MNKFELDNLSKAFNTISEKEWTESIRDYLSGDYKGAH